MQGQWETPDRVVISVSAKSVCYDCEYFEQGNDYYQRYCYCPELVELLDEDKDHVIKSCDGCKYVKLEEKNEV